MVLVVLHSGESITVEEYLRRKQDPFWRARRQLDLLSLADLVNIPAVAQAVYERSGRQKHVDVSRLLPKPTLCLSRGPGREPVLGWTWQDIEAWLREPAKVRHG